MEQEKIEQVRTVTGSFEVKEECDKYEVTGLGFAPSNVIVCEEEFKQGNVNTVAWLDTDVFSCHARYSSKTAVQPTIFNQTAGRRDVGIFLTKTADGFIVSQASANYPIRATEYKYVAW